MKLILKLNFGTEHWSQLVFWKSGPTHRPSEFNNTTVHRWLDCLQHNCRETLGYISQFHDRLDSKNVRELKVNHQIISLDADSHNQGASILYNMLTSKQFVGLANKNKCTCYYFHLKPLKEKRIIQETDTDINALIEKYKDMFPEQLPPGLLQKKCGNDSKYRECIKAKIWPNLQTFDSRVNRNEKHIEEAIATASFVQVLAHGELQFYLWIKRISRSAHIRVWCGEKSIYDETWSCWVPGFTIGIKWSSRMFLSINE